MFLMTTVDLSPPVDGPKLPTIIVARKLGPAVRDAHLDEPFGGALNGGQTRVLGVENGGVLLQLGVGDYG